MKTGISKKGGHIRAPVAKNRKAVSRKERSNASAASRQNSNFAQERESQLGFSTNSHLLSFLAPAQLLLQENGGKCQELNRISNQQQQPATHNIEALQVNQN